MRNREAERLLCQLSEHDLNTLYHSCRVAGMVAQLASVLNVSEEERRTYFTAALLHDVGKSKIPNDILRSPRCPLTTIEWDVIRQHPLWGAEIAKENGYTERICQMIREHHERLDGSGYPDGLHGDEIVLGARLIAVCDVADALYHKRSYKGALTKDDVIVVLQKEKESNHLDSLLVDALIQNWEYVMDSQKT